jgi:hypothetical protein
MIYDARASKGTRKFEEFQISHFLPPKIDVDHPWCNHGSGRGGMECSSPAGIPPTPALIKSSPRDRTLPCRPSWKTSFFIWA